MQNNYFNGLLESNRPTIHERRDIPMEQDLNFLDSVKHDYVNNKGVRIHYVTLGEGPLIVMIHGFPDYWYTWRHQMEILSKQFQVAAVDLRGYNESDKPKGVKNYITSLLAGDIISVIDHLGQKKAIVVGHDWGGSVSWYLAMKYPQRVERLIICNLPHPRALARELALNAKQQRNSQYARDFQKDGSHQNLTAEELAVWITDPEAKKKYIEAFEKSDFEAMVNYYKANYPREPYREDTSPVVKVRCPVLMIHGLKDWALLPGALNDTWKWVDNDLTLVTIPDAGHFVQQDAAELVTRSMMMWLNR